MNYRNYGFTLMEVLIVLTLLIIVAGFALFVSMDSYRGFAFRSERDTIVTVLQKARSQAMSNVCLGTGCSDGKTHGVRFTQSASECSPATAPCYIIFQGSFSSGDAVNQIIPMSDKVTITPVLPLIGPPFNIIFNQLDGTSAGGTFTISDGSHPPSQISINSEGQIDNP